MKDTASTAQREQNQRQGRIVGTITLPFRLLGVLIGSLLFSIVVECVGMHLFWKDQGWRHSQQMLQYELGHLSNHFTRSVVVLPESVAELRKQWVVGGRCQIVNIHLVSMSLSTRSAH